MRRTLWSLAVAILIAGTAVAVDVQFKDGTVVTAESYVLTGSYVMLELADGRRVAYDVTDVDLDALRAAEAAAATAGAAPEESATTLSSGRQLKDVATVGEGGAAGPTISDHDVRHVRGSGVRGGDEEGEEQAAAPGGTPEGFQEGGGVVLNGLRVTPLGEGRWHVEGEVINRNPNPVTNVRVQLETITSGGEEPWRGETPVTNYLGPDESGVFGHDFAAETPEGVVQPSVRASVIWMQEETRRVPDYTKAGGVPHPGNLPLEFGGVGGADVRPTPRM
jgi:hypothetical protein